MLTKSDAARLSHFNQHGKPLTPAQLEAMADRILQDSPDESGILSKHQMRHATRKENPLGPNALCAKRIVRQVG